MLMLCGVIKRRLEETPELAPGGAPDHGAMHSACCLPHHYAMQQCESTQGMAGALGRGSADDRAAAAIEDAVATALKDGAGMDEVLARVRARSGEGGPGPCFDGLIGLQRETNDFTEEWDRSREPGAEGRAALFAIESLRALTLRTMAALSARAEPVSTEELGRLALTLQRIERADGLRIEREQAAAGALAGAVPREPLSREEEMLGWPAEAEAPVAAWTADSGQASNVTPPAPAPDLPDGESEAQDAWAAPVAPRVSGPRGAPDPWSPRRAQKTCTTPEATGGEIATVTGSASDASEAPDTSDAPTARDVRDARGAPDEREWSVVRDLEMRRRDAARLLGPAGAPF